jgi:hypothetical protein
MTEIVNSEELRVKSYGSNPFVPVQDILGTYGLSVKQKN